MLLQKQQISLFKNEKKERRKRDMSWKNRFGYKFPWDENTNLILENNYYVTDPLTLALDDTPDRYIRNKRSPDKPTTSYFFRYKSKQKNRKLSLPTVPKRKKYKDIPLADDSALREIERKLSVMSGKFSKSERNEETPLIDDSRKKHSKEKPLFFDLRNFPKRRRMGDILLIDTLAESDEITEEEEDGKVAMDTLVNEFTEEEAEITEPKTPFKPNYSKRFGNKLPWQIEGAKSQKTIAPGFWLRSKEGGYRVKKHDNNFINKNVSENSSSRNANKVTILENSTEITSPKRSINKTLTMGEKLYHNCSTKDFTDIAFKTSREILTENNRPSNTTLSIVTDKITTNLTFDLKQSNPFYEEKIVNRITLIPNMTIVKNHHSKNKLKVKFNHSTIFENFPPLLTHVRRSLGSNLKKHPNNYTINIKINIPKPKYRYWNKYNITYEIKEKIFLPNQILIIPNKSERQNRSSNDTYWRNRWGYKYPWDISWHSATIGPQIWTGSVGWYDPFKDCVHCNKNPPHATAPYFRTGNESNFNFGEDLLLDGITNKSINVSSDMLNKFLLRGDLQIATINHLYTTTEYVTRDMKRNIENKSVTDAKLLGNTTKRIRKRCEDYSKSHFWVYNHEKKQRKPLFSIVSNTYQNVNNNNNHKLHHKRKNHSYNKRPALIDSNESDDRQDNLDIRIPKAFMHTTKRTYDSESVVKLPYYAGAEKRFGYKLPWKFRDSLPWKRTIAPSIWEDKYPGFVKKYRVKKQVEESMFLSKYKTQQNDHNIDIVNAATKKNMESNRDLSLRTWKFINNYSTNKIKKFNINDTKNNLELINQTKFLKTGKVNQKFVKKSSNGPLNSTVITKVTNYSKKYLTKILPSLLSHTEKRSIRLPYYSKNHTKFKIRLFLNSSEDEQVINNKQNSEEFKTLGEGRWLWRFGTKYPWDESKFARDPTVGPCVWTGIIEGHEQTRYPEDDPRPTTPVTTSLATKSSIIEAQFNDIQIHTPVKKHGVKEKLLELINNLKSVSQDTTNFWMKRQSEEELEEILGLKIVMKTSTESKNLVKVSPTPTKNILNNITTSSRSSTKYLSNTTKKINKKIKVEKQNKIKKLFDYFLKKQNTEFSLAKAKKNSDESLQEDNIWK